MKYTRLVKIGNKTKEDESNTIKIGSSEHESIRKIYEYELIESSPVFKFEVRTKSALNKIDQLIRKFGTEGAKQRLQGAVYDIVGIENRDETDNIYEQLLDYIKEFE